MSEWVWARIEIGGTVTRPQLMRLVEEFGVSPLPATQAASAPAATRSLGREDTQAAYGRFEALEAYLVEQAIPFDRASDGTYEHDPEVRKFRPVSDSGGGGNASRTPTDRVVPSDRDNQPAIALADITQAIAETRTRRQLVTRLTGLCGLDIPDLPPLNVVERH